MRIKESHSRMNDKRCSLQLKADERHRTDLFVLHRNQLGHKNLAPTDSKRHICKTFWYSKYRWLTITHLPVLIYLSHTQLLFMLDLNRKIKPLLPSRSGKNILSTSKIILNSLRTRAKKKVQVILQSSNDQLLLPTSSVAFSSRLRHWSISTPVVS